MEVHIEAYCGPWAGSRPVEIVERKGIGPDTICDMLSEQLSVALSRKYLDEFGLVLHHKVDKALLAAGPDELTFGDRRIVQTTRYLSSGHTTSDVRRRRLWKAFLARTAVVA